MRVVCFDNKGLEDFITVGRGYNVYSTKMLKKHNVFEIKDDKGNHHFIVTTRFRNIRKNKVLRILKNK